ncbi:MAG: CotH kinase family protein [Rikenellaceae bacterium]
MLKFNICTLFLLTLAVSTSCRDTEYIEEKETEKLEEEYNNDDEPYDDTIVDTSEYPDWGELTHSNAADPNYDVVFAQGEVLRIDITISSSSWSAMWSDLSANLGSSGGMGGGFGGGFGGGMGGGMDSDVGFTPMWAPCTITFNETEWYEVGVRFKGNSSLSQTYSSGNKKLSMKLDFDQFEDDYPALKNQRFYGFKQLNLNNNYEDESLMREKVAADLFREFGIAAAQTSFCEIYIDTGSGAEYYGVYTIVEEVDDTLIDNKEWFSDDSGNLYKPEDDAASFKSGSYDTDEFNLKTNTDIPDYSDVKSLYDALHDSSRTSNSVTWQAQLESVFNVDRFLKWLAANTIIQNWDTYGNMTHNYYIYTNPEDGLITWIPWDNNEAFQSGNSSIEVDEMGRVSSSWPLISYLFDVAEYEAKYKTYLREFVDDVFIVAKMQALYEEYYYLLKDYAYAEVSGRTFISYDSEFDSAVSTLKNHVQSRNNVVDNYLD